MDVVALLSVAACCVIMPLVLVLATSWNALRRRAQIILAASRSIDNLR